MAQSETNKKEMPSKKARPQMCNEDVVLPHLRIPVHIGIPVEGHRMWLGLFHHAEMLVKEDTDLQKKALKGLRLKDRRLPTEVLGRLYAQYCHLINKMYDVYLSSIQLQRAKYMVEIIAVFVKRLFELRNELVHYIVNDYVYFDVALMQLRMTPFDAQVIVPFHLPLEARPESVEQLLQKMWAASTKRLKNPYKVKDRGNASSKSVEIPPIKSALFDDDEQDMPPTPTEQLPEYVEEEEEKEIVPVVKESEIISEDFIQIVLIQRHVRFRSFYMADFRRKCAERRTFFAKKVDPAPISLQIRAAKIIQMVYREVMKVKRQRVIDLKRDILLGIVPDFDRRPLKFQEENEKLLAKRREKSLNVQLQYDKEFDVENKRIILFKRDNQIEDITAHIREWLHEWMLLGLSRRCSAARTDGFHAIIRKKVASLLQRLRTSDSILKCIAARFDCPIQKHWVSWYCGYGFFPPYPLEAEGGTVLVLTGEYETIEERQDDDDRIKAATKGKNKDTLKQEKLQAKLEEQIKKELEKERLKKEKLALFKARCNPQADPGYEVKQSENKADLIDVLRNYRLAWSIYDEYPPETCAEVIYGYMNSIIQEEIMNEIHFEVRKMVDELMRLELKLYIKAQKNMFNRVGWVYPKLRGRKRPKPIPIPKPFIVDDKVLSSVETILDLCIMSKPTTKIRDIQGDLSYAAYEYNTTDPAAKFPSPGYGDVKNRLVLSCVFGTGIQPGAPRNKSVLLLGQEKNGKSFLVDAVCGEINAVKFDISPEVFSSVVTKPGRLLSSIVTTARVFQPAVIFLKNVERVFCKKVTPEIKHLKAKAIKKPLVNMLKNFPASEKIIFIATCSKPFEAKAKAMIKQFNEVILVPRPDHGTIQQYLYNNLHKIRSVERETCVTALAKVLVGFGFGDIVKMFNQVMNPGRIVRLSAEPLQFSEFVEYLIANDLEPMTNEEYQTYMDFVIKYSPLKKEREEYEIINKTREYCYEKLAKKAADDAAKKKAKAKGT